MDWNPPRSPACSPLDRLIKVSLPSFDSMAQMLRISLSAPNYHTALTGGEVHPTRESLWYAVALLDTGNDFETAMRIFEKVISLQDTDPASATHGIWPWYLEEPVALMVHPDWNWADFCGVQLLEAMLTHRDCFPRKLAEAMKAAILAAARSIMRRDVTPDYTNIAIMGIFVTLISAELFDLKELREYALSRFRRFRDYTLEQGSFSEYNSPTYLTVTLNELARLRRYAGNQEVQEIASIIYRKAWLEIATHFHAPTCQWAGPHSRSYHTLLPSYIQALIRQATRGDLKTDEVELSLGDHRLRHECPKELTEYFAELTETRTVRQTFIKSEIDTVGTTYLTPDFTIGSINHSDLWNQRRALLAYWGEADCVSYLNLRFLRDGYDFSAAFIFSVQEEGRVLAGITFATDGGDRHISLDPIKDGAIQANDLRLRFELGGSGDFENLQVPSVLKEPFRLEIGTVCIDFHVPWARWGEQEGLWEIVREDSKTCLDVVLYNGCRKSFVLGELAKASLALAIDLCPECIQPTPVSVKLRDGSCLAEWKGLRLSFPDAPDSKDRIKRRFCATSSLPIIA